MLFNLHTHTRFSDGSEEPVKYLEEAIRQGFSLLGFSDHSPVPFDNNFAIREEQLREYVDTILLLQPNINSLHTNLQKSDPEQKVNCEILLGLEIDYISGITRSINNYRHCFPFDYFIGSVHFVKNGDSPDLWFIDGPDISIYDEGLKNIFGGDIRRGIAAYYRQIQELVVNEKPDIVGHLDKIKMYNRGRYFSEEDTWYVSLIDETLELIRQSGCVVEVNTRGIYKNRSESLFPGAAILRKVKELGIPVIISTDAHKPSELSLGVTDAIIILKEIGFKSQLVRTANKWSEIII